MSQHINRLEFETNLWSQNFKRIMGVDEAGRGCLSGPVVAAGVILSPVKENSRYRDSKTLSETERFRLAKIIRKESLFWTVQLCGPEEIDHLNIQKASITAMVRCMEAGGAPDYLLVDGNRFTSALIPHQCIVKGDDRSASIAAASILAKVHRDTLMKKLHLEYPFYGWNTNVGYPTKLHYEGLQKYGYTDHHRKSFNLRTDKKYQL